MPSYSGVWNLVQVYQAVAQGIWPYSPTNGPIGLFGGGYTTVSLNVIDKIAISTLGNATDFGDLTRTVAFSGSCSSSTRGLWGGGYTGTLNLNTIDYVSFSSIGNAIDFGDLTILTASLAGCSSSTRGIFGGGGNTTGYQNVIAYVTIATTGNALDFGDLAQNALYGLSACSSTTRGVFAGGIALGGVSTTNIIQYITIASTGNSIDFGDLTALFSYGAGCSDSTRGLFADYTNVINYITIASTGNAIDFGDTLRI